jgi:hypothetical protein
MAPIARAARARRRRRVLPQTAQRSPTSRSRSRFHRALSASASAGRIQRASTISAPSGTASCPSGSAREEKRVSKRRGRVGGVSQLVEVHERLPRADQAMTLEPRGDRQRARACTDPRLRVRRRAGPSHGDPPPVSSTASHDAAFLEGLAHGGEP